MLQRPEKQVALKLNCPLCGSDAALYFNEPERKYYQCRQCAGVFLDPAAYLSKEDERERYLQHNNDVNDPGYQKFVEPIILGVTEKFRPEHKGLDFGAGTGPVIAKLLGQKGYSIKLYDPFFWNNSQNLKDRYDFIVCCEVIEHFQHPAGEFKLLKSLLKPRGVLFCMTDFYKEKLDFKSWYYKDDPTHVFFYHLNTLFWVRSNFGFSTLECKERLARFTA